MGRAFRPCAGDPRRAFSVLVPESGFSSCQSAKQVLPPSITRDKYDALARLIADLRMHEGRHLQIAIGGP